MASMSASDRPSSAPPAPPKPRRRWLRWVLGGVLALVLLPVIGVATLLLLANSESGRERIVALAAGAVPGLVLEGMEGPLPGRLGFRRIALADSGGIWLEVENARLAWDPLALLRREAHVTLLAADRVAVLRLPEASEAAPSEPGGPLVPDLPELPLAIRLDRLEVARIELAAPVLGEAAMLRAEGGALLDAAGLTARLSAAAPEPGDSFSLDAALRPATGRLQARISLRGAAGGPVSRLIGQPDRAPSLDLTLDGPAEGAALALWAEAGPGVSADLSGTLRAVDATRLGADLTGRIDASGLLAPPFAALAGPLEIALRGERMPDGATDLAAMRLAGRAGVIEASGRLAADGNTLSLGLSANLAGSDAFAGLLPEELVGWSALVIEASAEGPVSAPVVEATVAPAGFRSSIAPLAALLGETPRLVFQGTPPDRIALLTVTGSALRLEARGLVGETLDLTFGADVAAVEGAAPGVVGALQLSGTARGPLANPDLTVTARSNRLELAGQVLEALSLDARVAKPATAPAIAATLAGRFQELPLSLDLRGGPEGEGTLRLQAARASLGPAMLEAEGSLALGGPIFDGSATLSVPDLAPLSRLAGQPLAGSLRLEAQMTGQDGQQHVAARLAAPRITAAGADVRDLAVTVDGTEADAAFTLAARASGAEAEARGRQTRQPDGARRIDLAMLRAAGFGETLRLAAPGRVTLRADGGIDIGSLAFAASRGATLRAQGNWGPERADIRASLGLPDLATLAPLLPDIAPTGRLTAEARITGRTTAPEVTATLRASQLRAGAPAARGLPPAEVSMDARRAATGAISARAIANLGSATRLTATAALPRGPDGPLEAALNGPADLGALIGPLLAAGADRVTGRITLALRAGGTLAAPVLGGEARLAGGSWRNPVLGVTLSDLGGTLRADGSRLRADLTGRTPGEGRIALTGTVDPLATGIPVDLALRANQAQPIASDLVRATLDAALTLTGALQSGATLAGPITLRRVDIRVPERLPSTVRTLGEVTERGRPPGRPPAPPAPARRAAPAASEGGLPIALALQVEAPRAIFVRGRGLDVEMGGSLAIGGTISAPDVSGEIALRRGEIRVLARRLALTRGRLDFQGGLLPELDFEASSQAGGTTVSATVTGPPNAPEIAFSSTPELPQDEVLARLLFDRPVSDLSPFELAQIAQAIAGATGIGGGGAGGVLERVRETLGLDRLAVGGGGEAAARTTAAQERAGPTLEAGRYVADGVYVGVRQGTDTGSSRVGVRVDLTPRLRLEAETGDRQAGERVGVSMEWQWGR